MISATTMGRKQTYEDAVLKATKESANSGSPRYIHHRADGEFDYSTVGTFAVAQPDGTLSNMSLSRKELVIMNAARTCNRYLVAAAFVILAVPSPAGTSTRQARRPAESPLSQTARASLMSGYGNLPLAFEPNQGQTDARVRFLARGGGMLAFFTDTETALVLSRSPQAKTPDGPRRSEGVAGEVEQAVVRMKLAGAGQPRRAIGLDQLPGISNYFIGNDRAKWRTDVPHYARIEYDGVYPGIDLVWYGNQRQLEYDFVVAPGADPSRSR